jgi:hypothetical protein
MQITSFLRLVHENQNALARAQQIYADQLAPGFDPFAFAPPDEMQLSRILGARPDSSGTGLFDKC